MNRFGHIDLRVSEMGPALGFYDVLLPALGYTERCHGEEWKVWATTDPLPTTAYFGITEDRAHAPNGNRIAFWLESSAEVDRLAEIARGAGAVEVSGPKAMPYAPGYYAAYFADPSGNLFEIYVRPA